MRIPELWLVVITERFIEIGGIDLIIIHTQFLVRCVTFNAYIVIEYMFGY